VKWEVNQRNPAAYATLSRVPKWPLTTPTPEETERVLARAQDGESEVLARLDA